MRAVDQSFMPDLFQDLDILLDDKKLLISEMTSHVHKKLGDLFMYGDIMYLKKLWSVKPWRYEADGLTNLYENFDTLGDDFEQIFKFITVEKLMWVDLERNWGKLRDKQPLQYDSNCLWGRVWWYREL